MELPVGGQRGGGGGRMQQAPLLAQNVLFDATGGKCACDRVDQSHSSISNGSSGLNSYCTPGPLTVWSNETSSYWPKSYGGLVDSALSRSSAAPGNLWRCVGGTRDALMMKEETELVYA
ncbi:hypothetical protein INR49_016783 [Caranx melampygus]|nr:hypothetical protein INR49_016783 [Caranx melampygus]